MRRRYRKFRGYSRSKKFKLLGLGIVPLLLIAVAVLFYKKIFTFLGIKTTA